MNQMGIHEKTLTAFTLEPIDVGGLKIYPASMAHLLAMRKYAPNLEGQMDEEQGLAAIVIFATPEAEDRVRNADTNMLVALVVVGGAAIQLQATIEQGALKPASKAMTFSCMAGAY